MPQSDSAYAKTTNTCYGPQVSKSAEPSYTRTYTWTIDKQADAE